MSMSTFQPVGQKRLTNIAIVKYKKFGKRFEVACYKNKVLNWRNGIEKDIDEVLQTTTVFSNVSKGLLAKREDLLEVFGTDDEMVICRKILAEGEMQVSDKERKVELDTLFRDVASVLSEKCINPETNRPYTISMIERALKDVHFNLDPKKAAKSQALEALPLLQARFPIERARMRLKAQVPLGSKDELMDVLRQRQATLEEQDLVGSGMISIVCLVDPGAYRIVHNMVQGCSGRLEVVSLAAIAEEREPDVKLESLNINSTPVVIGGGGGQESNAAADATMFIQAPSAIQQQQQPIVEQQERRVEHVTTTRAPQSAPVTVVYPRGPITELPEEHASRKERFAELDTLQDGWTVELTTRGEGGIVDAVFYSPSGDKVGAFAGARRLALQAKKAAA